MYDSTQVQLPLLLSTLEEQGPLLPLWVLLIAQQCTIRQSCGEEMRVKASAYGTQVVDEEAKDKLVVEFNGEMRCDKEGRVGNQSDRKTIRSII